MNYFLLVVILAVCGGAYYTHMQDQQRIDGLQSELDDAQKAATTATAAATAAKAAPPAVSMPSPTAPQAAPVAGDLTHPLDGPTPILSNSAAPSGPIHHATVVSVDDTHAGAVDSAAAAAEAAESGTDLGTVTTLDNHTYTNCKVVRVEDDGVTFSDDQGITKIEFALMPPDLQKKFGYTPQGAVAQTEAQIRADQQQQTALTNAAPAAP